MHLSHSNILKSGLSPWKILLLDAARQQTKEKNLEEVIASYIQSDSELEELISKQYIKVIKTPKKASELSRLRIDKNGKKLLEKIQEVESEEQDRLFTEWLVKLYREKGKTIKSSKKLLGLVAWFRTATGIEKNKLGYLLQKFVAIQEETDFKYSHNVNNVFWKPENLYQSRPNLDNSRLYNFYLEDKEKFDKEFENF